MDRRSYLQGVSAAGVAGIAGYGVYATVIRSPSPPLEATVEDDHEPATYDDSETRDGDILLGVTPPSIDVTVLDPFEEWLGARHAVVGQFLDMGQPPSEIERLVYSRFESIWARGHVPHVYWQPFFPDRDNTSLEVNSEIAAGEFDEQLRAWAGTIAHWAMRSDEPDRRVYLNLAPEFNGDWSPWSPALGNDDETEFVAMWRHVHEMMSEAGLGPSHVQWIWTLDNTTRGVDPEAAYPGDEYVDWAGVHGYNWVNWGGWKSPGEVYGSTIDAIRGITDAPIAITEFGSSSETEDGGNDPARKDDWIRDAYAYLREVDVRMPLYFDFVKETDWAVFDTEFGTDSIDIDGVAYEVSAAYKEVATDERTLPAHPDHPRILTDEEFAGQF